MSLTALYRALKRQDKPMELCLLLKAVSKERPRTGKGGHVYTPKRTQKFEKMVAEAGATLLRQPYTCPVKVWVEIREPIPKSFPKWKQEAARLRLISPQVGDLDNKIKAITDGLNGVCYIDDKQINHVGGIRVYGDNHEIYITIERSGLSIGELQGHNERRSSEGGARLG